MAFVTVVVLVCHDAGLRSPLLRLPAYWTLRSRRDRYGRYRPRPGRTGDGDGGGALPVFSLGYRCIVANASTRAANSIEVLQHFTIPLTSKVRYVLLGLEHLVSKLELLSFASDVLVGLLHAYKIVTSCGRRSWGLGGCGIVPHRYERCL